MNRCSLCLREIGESETVCDRCAYEAADPVDGQPTLQSVVTQNASAAPSPEGVLPPKARTNRLMMFSLLAALAFGGTIALALLPGSEAPAAAVTTAPTRSAAEAPAVATVTPMWKTNPQWVGFQKRSVALELPANHKVPVWQRHAHPYLVVRCSAKRLDAFVFMESTAQIEPQDERHTVHVRVDDGPDVTERWQDSDEHDALFAPDGIGFAQQLMSAKVLRVGYKPHNAEPVVAEFSIGGLREALAPFAAQCGLKK